MASKKCIYVVTMYRWADTECHSYVLGAYTKKQQAINRSEEERIYRGCTKYYPRILEFGENGEDEKVIVELPDHPFMKQENKPMEKCPKCGNYSIDYSSYKKKYICHVDGCSVHKEKDGSYSVLRNGKRESLNASKYKNTTR